MKRGDAVFRQSNIKGTTYKTISQRTAHRLMDLHPKQNIESEIKWQTRSMLWRMNGCLSAKGLKQTNLTKIASRACSTIHSYIYCGWLYIHSNKNFDSRCTAPVYLKAGVTLL